MGRYYNGDIKGKFWFGVQNSNDASFFGGEENEPNYIEYSFEKENDLQTIQHGIQKCKETLGINKKKLDKFYKTHRYYNNEEIAKELNIMEIDVPTLLGWYARLELGKKIEKCVLKKGYCTFEAEL